MDMVPIKNPVLNSRKSIKQPGLSQVLSASRKYLFIFFWKSLMNYFSTISISNSRSLKRPELIIKTIEYIDYSFSGNQNKWETTFDKGTICAKNITCVRGFLHNLYSFEPSLHSGSKWLNPTKNKFTRCDFTNFFQASFLKFT